jgi:hypothetical protein
MELAVGRRARRIAGGIAEVVESAGASAVALGGMVVFPKKGMVLVNFPKPEQLAKKLAVGAATYFRAGKAHALASTHSGRYKPLGQ